MKKLVLSLWVFLLIASLLTAFATPILMENERPIRVELNGTAIDFDVEPIVLNDRTMVPVRAVLEAMGAQVSWEASTNAVYAQTLHHGQLRHVIGTKSFTLDGITHTMDNPSISRNERTLVPIRFFAEALGHSVSWSDSIWGVVISAQTPPGASLALTNMDFPLQNAADIEVYHFDFGDAGLISYLGTPIDAPLTGIVAAPSGTETLPLVFIMHGATPTTSVHDPSYAGFDYLVRQLAAEGYVVVSVNVNVEYTLDFGEAPVGEWAYKLFELYLENLAHINEGEDLGIALNLENRIDFSEIHLIGHSRGGKLADVFVRNDREAGDYRIASIFRLAPEEVWEESYPDIPTAILLPEFDGDLDSLGQIAFDMIKDHGEHEHIVSLVNLRGANHNYFSRAMIRDDGIFHVNRLTRAQQEDFLMRYTAAFLAYVRGQQAPWGIFDPTVPQPRTMFGMEVIASTLFDGKQTVIAAPTAQTVNVPTTSGDVNLSYHVQTFGIDGGLFNHPGVLARPDMRLPLYNIQWGALGGNVTFPTTVSDFSTYSALSFYVSLDPTNECNQSGRNQAFTVVLTDHTGNVQEVFVPAGTPALTWHHGEFFYSYFLGERWQGFTPLGELRIPLSLFTGLDMNDITSIGIDFGHTPSGSIMLSGAYLVA